MSQTPPDDVGPQHEAPTEIVNVSIRRVDLERLDHAAERRGIERDDMIREAIDAFLAREIWSGGFVAPPPMEVPKPLPWRPGAFRRQRRS